MATISTDTYLDGGVARTAGEAWTINGATLTIRTDTRWHANAPASMTGSLGSITMSSALGGAMTIDGTKVRWMAFDTGSGTVPAIGTTITQGGVSGYLLGVWADYQSAPTAVGSAMPASGFLKFREVTGGTFSAGALSGISANASSADVTGWIEVVMDASSQISTQELGNGLNVTGSWFDLGTTNGSRGQVISTPTNGGGSGTHIFGVQIETSAGSGVYEWYPTAAVAAGASNWSTANFTTDARAKIVESMGNGQIRIGSDGTNNIGYLPPSGCKIRIPNIFGRTVATASRATNQVPGAVTRCTFGGGNYSLIGMHCDFAFASSTTAVKTVIKNFTSEKDIVLQDSIAPPDIDNCCFGGFTSGAVKQVSLTRFSNGSFKNSKVIHSFYILGAFEVATCTNMTFQNVEVIGAKSRTGGTSAFSISGSSGCTFSGVKLKGAGNIAIVGSRNITVSTIDYIDRLEGNTTSNTASFVVNFQGSQNITVDGLTFGEGGTISNTQPYNTVFSCSTNANTGIKIRNAGSRNSPLDCGSNASFYPANLLAVLSGDSGIKLQRCYMTNVRTGIIQGSIGTNLSGFVFEDVFITSFANNMPTPAGYNAVFRKVCGSAPAAANSNLGCHWYDAFTSNTAGYIKWLATGPSTDTTSLQYLTATANQGTGFITTLASVSMDTLGDYVIGESSYQFKGHTSFQNVAPTLTGSSTTGVTVYYDLDTGSGFSGTWKTATGANLSAETVSAAGFKMKVKLVATGSVNTAMAITGVSFATNSTQAAQADNLYPLDTNTLSFTGLATGSEVRCYVGTNPATATEVGGIESTAGSTFNLTHSVGGQDGYIMILAMGYQPIYIPYTYKTADDSILIQPVVDRNYVNP